MRNTGIVRKIDELGRIVIPKELRKSLGIDNKDPIEIYTQDDTIVLKKFQKTCLFCGAAEELISFKGKTICKNCKEEITK